MNVRLGFIGVGDMGRPLARRLLRAGFALTVHDTNDQALAAIVADGADAAPSAQAVADAVEIVFACLPSPTISERVALGEHGVAQGSRVRHYIEMSTIGGATMERLAQGLGERRIGLLDAPVSGGPTGERAGRLTCFVATPRAQFEACEAALRGMSDRLFHVGERPGQAQVLKLANNMLNAANLTLAIEMVLMAGRAGIDEATAIEVINVSTGRSRATEETFKAQILNRSFSTGARLDILAKDTELAIKQARTLGTPHHAATAVQQLWTQAVTEGHGSDDLSRIYEFIAQAGGKS
ncbi:NAD(P)-dependent oxidoreductase [Ottowia thiooxydans]|uniref:3-hydroxyisobutyrate dehydrogenase-like beta-hydroxyacid dehydrogenase n=1 Tax=Ottowia thiooxydans TaxID=219182 RepID=A0ABV2QHD9_9BURK